MVKRKLKLHVVSDLHLDSFKHKENVKLFSQLKKKDIDALVIAGDFGDGGAPYFLRDMCKQYENVIFCLGNHDHYGKGFELIRKQCGELVSENSNLHFLDYSNKVEIKGHTFKGGTFWYPYQDTFDFNYLINYWPDSKCIPGNYQDWLKAETPNCDNLLASIQKDDIVLTHMLPSQLSIHPDFKDAETNMFFIKNAENVIKTVKPKVWIHGHTHYHFDYKIGDTRIYCNPRGYLGENRNPNFLKTAYLEIE